MNNKAEDFLLKSSNMIEEYLDKKLVTLSNYNKVLIESIRYSVYSGGKRLRPALVYAGFSIFNKDMEKATPFAAAIELIHTYSLIHDDLPAMDNDDIRRGKPANHKVYGEAEAILAGDALLTKAFELISDKEYKYVSDRFKLLAIESLSKAAGDNGMVGGQFVDIQSEGKVNADENLVNYIHSNKTAALISCSLELGAIAAEQDEYIIKRLKSFGYNIGFAFQIVDDILDVTSSTQELGKTVGKDINSKKITYTSLFTVEESYKKANKYIDKAMEEITFFGKDADLLIELAKFVMERRS